jgi:hypothetical protein
MIPERYKSKGFNKVGQKKQSTRPGKKWMVLAKKGDSYKIVHGGDDSMQDYTQHHSEERRKNFWNRMGGKDSSKAQDPFSPLYWHKRFGTWAYGGENTIEGEQDSFNPYMVGLSDIPMFGPGGQWLDKYKDKGEVKSTFNPYENVNRIGTSDNTKVYRVNPDQVEKAKKAAAIKNEKIVQEYQQRQSYIGPDKRTKAEIDKGIALKKEYDRVKAMQNSDLAKTFASFTPGNNIEAGVMGAETFANLNPLISGPILATSRLAPAIMHPTNNAYWRSGRSNLENAFGALGAIGDISMVSPFFKGLPAYNLAGTEEIIDNLGNKYLPDVSKYYPWRFKENPNSYYRQVFSADKIENPTITRSMVENNDPKGVNAFIKGSEENFIDAGTNTPFELLRLPTTESLPYFNKGKVYYGKNFTKNIKEPELLIENKIPFKDYEDFYPAATNYISVNPEQASQALQMSGNIRVLSPFSKAGHNLENYNLYKPHWLQGYKPVNKSKIFTKGQPYEGAPHVYQDMYPINKTYYPRTVITDAGVKDEILGLESTPIFPLNTVEYPATDNKFLNQTYSSFGRMEKGRQKQNGGENIPMFGPGGENSEQIENERLLDKQKVKDFLEYANNPILSQEPGVRAHYDPITNIIHYDNESDLIPEFAHVLQKMENKIGGNSVPLYRPTMMTDNNQNSEIYTIKDKKKLDLNYINNNAGYLNQLKIDNTTNQGSLGNAYVKPTFGNTYYPQSYLDKVIDNNFYFMPGTSEYDAHQIIEPELGGYLSYKNGGQHGGLDRWFAEKWVDIKTGKPCGRKEGENRNYPACRPSKRISEGTPKTASELSASEKEKFKNEKTSSQRISYNHNRKQYGGDNINYMKYGGNIPTNSELWSRAKAVAKSKYDVYPSAYANGFAAKWYKEHGGSWKKAQYGMDVYADMEESMPMYGIGGENTAQGEQSAFNKYMMDYFKNNPDDAEFNPNVVNPDSTFEVSDELKNRLKKNRQEISPIRKYGENLQYDIKTGTGQYDFSPEFKGFNALAQITTGVANMANDAKARRYENDQYLKALTPQPKYNVNEGGLNNIPMYGPGGQNQPTASDSLAVMNSAIASQKYYDNLTKKGWYDTPHVSKNVYHFDKNKLNQIEEESLKTYNAHLKDPAFYKNYYAKNVYPTVTEENIKKKALQSLLEIKNKKSNTYIYKDLYPNQIDEWAPSTVIDMRIKPQNTITYNKKTDLQVPGAAITSIMAYDPIAVKPAAMKTASDWAYMKKTYGTKPPVTTSRPPAITSKPPVRQTINTTMGQVTGTVRPNQIKGSQLTMMINPVRSKENLERMEMIPYTFNNPKVVPNGELLPMPSKQTVDLGKLTETRTHPIDIYDRKGNFLRQEFTGNSEGVVNHNYIGEHHYAPRGGNSYIDTNYSEGGSIPMYGPGGQNSPKVYTDKKMFNQAKQNYTDSLFLHNNPVVVDSYFPDAMDLDLNKHVASSFKSATSPLGGTYDVHPIKKINKKILNDLVNDSIKDRTVPDYDDDLELFERRKKRNKVLIDSVLKMKKTGFQPVASTEPGYFGQTMFFKKPVQPVTYQSAPTHPIENLEKLEMMAPSLNGSNIQMQGQTIPMKPMKLKQRGTKPVYGPGHTLIGFVGDGMQFYPGEYTGAPNNQMNLQDKYLLDNPELLKEYLKKIDTYKFAEGGEVEEYAEETPYGDYFTTVIPMLPNFAMGQRPKPIIENTGVYQNNRVVVPYSTTPSGTKNKPNVYNDFYEKSQKYLSRGIFNGTSLTPSDIANAAEKFYNETGYKYPIELLLSQGQLETKLGKELKSKNNFFNVGNTDEGDTRNYATPQDSVYDYINLMYKDYLQSGKKDYKDLLNKGFVNYQGNRYASNPNYENEVLNQSQFINRFINKKKTGGYAIENYGEEIPMFGPGGQNQPTASDSLAVMNNTNALINYFKNYNLKKNKNVLNTRALAELEKFYLEDLANNFNVEYPTSNGKWVSGKLPKNVQYINIDKNKYKKRENSNSVLDTRSPMQLIDRRIPPSFDYYGEANINPSRPTIDGISFFGYDPIAVKPAAMKTASDWAYMQKTYGTKPPVTTSKPPARQTINTTQGQIIGTINPNLIKGSQLINVTNPIRPKTNLKRLEMVAPSLDTPDIQMQGQLLPIPQMKLPQQGNIPFYGPGNTIVGYTDESRQFYPANDYTGAQNNQSNLQDKELLDNPELLQKYVQSKDTYKFAKGGETNAKFFKILRDGEVNGKKLTDKQRKFFGVMAFKKYGTGGDNFQDKYFSQYKGEIPFEMIANMVHGIPGYDNMPYTAPLEWNQKTSKPQNYPYFPDNNKDPKRVVSTIFTNPPTDILADGTQVQRTDMGKSNPVMFGQEDASQNDWLKNLTSQWTVDPRIGNMQNDSFIGPPEYPDYKNQYSQNDWLKNLTAQFTVDPRMINMQNDSFIGPPDYPYSEPVQQDGEWTFTPQRVDYNKKYVPLPKKQTTKTTPITKTKSTATTPIKTQPYTNTTPTAQTQTQIPPIVTVQPQPTGYIPKKRYDDIWNNPNGYDGATIPTKAYSPTWDLGYRQNLPQQKQVTYPSNTSYLPRYQQGGGLNEGMEADLSLEQIKQLQSQGYKIEIL